ncbi:zinc finger CCHC domain-containing protein 8 homolog isoform X2 [Ornithodoros turicata]|uniref:zinc finger CCHC domain-containing protein 8 homolog isoform X2 n=1 Tax=Ornithodoros turicata TaxID=34597 RepID=UPI0031394364
MLATLYKMASPSSTVSEKTSEQQDLKPLDEGTSVGLREGNTNPEDNGKSEDDVEVVFFKPASDCEVVYSSLDCERKDTTIDLEDLSRDGDVENETAEENSFFIIDKTGGGDTGQRPLYINDCIGVLGDSHVPETPKELCPSMECFNCGGDHHLNMCTKDIDRARVSKNRREAAKNLNVKNTRYHVEEGQKERFKPGHLSNEMRRALDIGAEELPPFIYRMRVLGYPPGWLMEAEVESSGLKIYGSDGKAVEDENIEDGEIHSTEKHVQYDPNKLIRFPGYNVPTPPGVYDQCTKYDMPPMQPHQQLSEAKKYMKAPEATPFKKRKKLTLPPPVGKPEAALEMDMELDSDLDVSTNWNEDTASLHASPSGCVMPSPPSSVLETTHEDSSRIPGSLHSSETSPHKDNDLGWESEDTADAVPESKKSGARVCLSQSVTLGTPIISGFSGYEKLPPRENFSKGISEHIPFENLPGATGTYDRLRGVLTKVRMSMSEEQREDSGNKFSSM